MVKHMFLVSLIKIATYIMNNFKFLCVFFPKLIRLIYVF